LVVLTVGAWFFIDLLTRNIWALLTFLAFLSALVLSTFINHATRIEELEARLSAPEKANTNQHE
jgi:hypothetical protein